VLQAAIAACHARARAADETDWSRIAALYAELAHRTPSPVIELNRAVAVSMAQGPAAGLELVDALTAEPTLKSYHLLPSVRGDLLAKLCAQLRPMMATIGQPGCFRMRAAHRWFVWNELRLMAVAGHSRANLLQPVHLQFPVAS
jgi:predicted RNA polymerase sigma factor